VQGITVLVSSGDSGAAGCDSPTELQASHGLGVNGLCSTPYSVCVGGTEFSDSNSSLYWSQSNTSGTQGSALSYIPEVAWNESGADGLWARAAAPSFAGIMALVVQNADAPVGNANPFLYALAAKQAAEGAPVFHDVTTGNNSVPGQTGFSAGPGYDRVTGLGSVDANVLVNHWSDATPAATFHVVPSATSMSVQAGTSGVLTFNVTARRRFRQTGFVLS
jgi:pseudomonalisin